VNEWSDFLSTLRENLISNPGQYNHTYFSEIYMTIFCLFNVVAIVVLARYMGAQKVVLRRYFRVFIWVIFLVGTGVLLPFFSLEILPLAIIPSTVILSFWIDKMARRWVQETVIWLLVLLTFFGQLFLY
jgi:hypothetical protein